MSNLDTVTFEKSIFFDSYNIKNFNYGKELMTCSYKNHKESTS